ncbi:MAG: hypothetical protein HY680_09250 [Chloroflexi bacterium]|nr:hypothetical protein [Chloroflexota bacterium]
MKRTGSILEVAFTGGLKEESPAFAGAGLLAELSRHSGTSAAAERVESCILLSAPGGACMDDRARLRDDGGLGR